MLSLLSSRYTGEGELNEKSFEMLKKQLGSDVLVYDLVARAHEIYSEKCGFNLIQKLLSIKSFNNYHSEFKEISRKNFSYNYAHKDRKSVSRNLENHITTIYSDYFGDVDKKLIPAEDRGNHIQLHLLRLLCRLKNKDILYSEVKRIWNFSELLDGEKNIYNVIENLGWVKKDRICIPDFIAYAFNRKNLINEVQYYEELSIRHALNYFTTHQSYAPTNSELYNALFECFLEDYCYLQDRAKDITYEHHKEIRKIVKKNDKIVSEKLKEDFESAKSEVVLDKFWLLSFLLETLTFSLRYNKPDLWKAAKKILEQEEPDTLILDLVNKFDDSLNFKFDAWLDCDVERCQCDGSAQLFLMEVFIYLLNKEVLKYIENKGCTENINDENDNCFRNKIHKGVAQLMAIIGFYENRFCGEGKNDNETHKEIVDLYTELGLIYYILSWCNKCENRIDYLECIKKTCYFGGVNTKKCENYLVLICFKIMSY